MKRLILIMLSASLAAVFSVPLPFPQFIESTKEQILSTDYTEASLTIQQARTSLATLANIKRDYSATKAAGLTDSSKAISELALNALADATAKYSQNDVPGMVGSLDLAFLTTSALSTLQPPAQRYSFAKAALQKAVAANQTGDGLDPFLHRAAAAYAAGQFDESLGYINQALLMTR